MPQIAAQQMTRQQITRQQITRQQITQQQMTRQITQPLTREGENHRPEGGGVYQISVAATLAGMHPQTLRQYERRGLLEPGRTAGGTRRYSPRDLARLHRIGELTAAGVNLEGVRRILDLEEELAALRASAPPAPGNRRAGATLSHDRTASEGRGALTTAAQQRPCQPRGPRSGS